MYHARPATAFAITTLLTLDSPPIEYSLLSHVIVAASWKPRAEAMCSSMHWVRFSILERRQGATVDGRNPANHLKFIKTCKYIMGYSSINSRMHSILLSPVPLIYSTLLMTSGVLWRSSGKWYISTELELQAALDGFTESMPPKKGFATWVLVNCKSPKIEYKV